MTLATVNTAAGAAAGGSVVATIVVVGGAVVAGASVVVGASLVVVDRRSGVCAVVAEESDAVICFAAALSAAGGSADAPIATAINVRIKPPVATLADIGQPRLPFPPEEPPDGWGPVPWALESTADGRHALSLSPGVRPMPPARSGSVP